MSRECVCKMQRTARAKPNWPLRLYSPIINVEITTKLRIDGHEYRERGNYASEGEPTIEADTSHNQDLNDNPKTESAGGYGSILSYAGNAAAAVGDAYLNNSIAGKALGALGLLALAGETTLGTTFGDGQENPSSAASMAREMGTFQRSQEGSGLNKAAEDLKANTATGVEVGLSALPGATAFEVGQALHGQDIAGREATTWTFLGVIAGIFGFKKAGAADEAVEETAEAAGKFGASRKAGAGQTADAVRGLGGRILSVAEKAEFEDFAARAQKLGLTQNPSRTGSWGKIVDGKWKEIARIDVAEAGKPGFRGKTHIHILGIGDHLPPNTPLPGE